MNAKCDNEKKKQWYLNAVPDARSDIARNATTRNTMLVEDAHKIQDDLIHADG
jgi:hypothetical protein